MLSWGIRTIIRQKYSSRPNHRPSPCVPAEHPVQTVRLQAFGDGEDSEPTGVAEGRGGGTAESLLPAAFERPVAP